MILRHIIILYMQSTFTTSKHSSHSYSCHSSLYTLHLFLVFCWNFIPFEDWYCQVRNCDNISELLNFIKPLRRSVCPVLAEGVSKLFYLSAVITVPTTSSPPPRLRVLHRNYKNLAFYVSVSLSSDLEWGLQDFSFIKINIYLLEDYSPVVCLICVGGGRSLLSPLTSR